MKKINTMLDQYITLLDKLEGKIKYPYQDTKGYLTVGVGHKPNVIFTKDFDENNIPKGILNLFNKPMPTYTHTYTYTIKESLVNLNHDFPKGNTSFLQEHIQTAYIKAGLSKEFFATPNFNNDTKSTKNKEYEIGDGLLYFDYLIIRGARLTMPQNKSIDCKTLLEKGISEDVVNGIEEKDVTTAQLKVNSATIKNFRTRMKINDHLFIEKGIIKTDIFNFANPDLSNLTFKEIGIENYRAEYITLIDMMYWGIFHKSPLTIINIFLSIVFDERNNRTKKYRDMVDLNIESIKKNIKKHLLEDIYCHCNKEVGKHIPLPSEKVIWWIMTQMAFDLYEITDYDYFHDQALIEIVDVAPSSEKRAVAEEKILRGDDLNTIDYPKK